MRGRRARREPAATPRERISFNGDWRFTKNDPAEASNQLSAAAVRDWTKATGAAFAKDLRRVEERVEIANDTTGFAIQKSAGGREANIATVA